MPVKAAKMAIEQSMEEAGGNDLDGNVAAWIVDKWAGTSADESKPALMLQQAAHEMYGEGEFDKRLQDKLNAQSSINYSTNYVGYHTTVGLTDAEMTAKQKKFLEITRQKTQEYFKKLGYEPDDEIVLYRGVTGIPRLGKAQPGETVKVGSWPLSSWSAKRDTAVNFSSGPHGAVLKRKVKIKEIVSSCRTGLGCLCEQEFVIIASKNQMAVKDV